MTPSQLIHLARVAGGKDIELGCSDTSIVFSNGDWYRPHHNDSEGVAQFRELFLSLDYNQHLSVYEKWAKLCGLDGCYPIEFAQWLFLHLADACQIIFEVTSYPNGGPNDQHPR